MKQVFGMLDQRLGKIFKNLHLAQGLIIFYSRGNIDPNATGSVWGADDEYLYDAIFKQIDDNKMTFQ